MREATVAKLKKVYWDSCAWLGLINGEPNKRRGLEIIYSAAKRGDYEIWTSTISLVEVNRLADEKDKKKPLEIGNAEKLQQMFEQPFVKLATLDLKIGRASRKLFRETVGLSKRFDAVHLATALAWSVDALHTYDRDDLLHVSGKLTDAKGRPLLICYPDEHSDGPLFAHLKRGS
jgi:predicted nucleic acid-binding protein